MLLKWIQPALSGAVAALVVAAVAAPFAVSMAQDPAPAPSGSRLAAGTAFTYQGRLDTGGGPVDGSFDFEFRLFDAPSDGAQVPNGGSVVAVTRPVAAGLFSAELDFGPTAFDGQARWLEVKARLNGAGAFETLDPRQPLSPVPYALHALSGGTQYGAQSPIVLNATTFGLDSAGCAAGDVWKYTGAGWSCDPADAAHTHTGETWGANIARGTNGALLAPGMFVLNNTASPTANPNKWGGIAMKGITNGGIGVFGVATHDPGPLPGIDLNSLVGAVVGHDIGNPMTFQCEWVCVGVKGLAPSGVGSTSVGVYGSGGTRGVYGASNSGTGVEGVSSSGTGVFGNSDTHHGVVGNSVSGAGVYASSTSYYAINATSTNAPGIFSLSMTDDGIVASARTAGKSGLFGVNDDSQGMGVTGNATSGVGVYGTGGGGSPARPINTGVFGHGNGANSTGVYGRGDGNNSSGVKGVAGTGTGALAGWFIGHVSVSSCTGCGNPSDARLKHDIVPSTRGLDDVLALQAVSFAFNDDKYGAGKHLGFLAQDVQRVIPEIVSEMEDGYLRIDNDELIPVLINAIQEQQSQIEALKGAPPSAASATGATDPRIEALEARLAEIEGGRSGGMPGWVWLAGTLALAGSAFVAGLRWRRPGPPAFAISTHPE